jgi:pseudouridine kinase
MVAVYGAANIDIHAVCFNKYIHADSNPGSSYISIGGVGRNIAENCVRLGLHVDLVTVLGDDEFSSVIINDCEKLGIGLGQSLFLKNIVTPRYICTLDSDGSLVGAVAAMEALESFSVAEFEKRTGAGDNAGIIVLDACLPEPVINAACKRWNTKALFFDPVSVAKAGKALGCLGSFSIIKPNLNEALLLAGLEQKSALTEPLHITAKKSAEILRQRGVGEVFISAGSAGLLYFSGSGCGIVRPLDMPLVNVSGAGDAASAGIVWASLSNCNTMQKARYAVATASLCVSSADTVSKKMSREYLEELAREVQHEFIS